MATKGEYKAELLAIVDATVPGDDETNITTSDKSSLCESVVAYHVDTVNPDKENYPKIKFKS